MIEGHKLIQAHFANNERTNIELHWQSDDDDNEVRIEFCEADESDEVYKWLLTQMSIDDLHEATVLHIREQDAIYREAVIEIAKSDGLLHNQKDGMVNTAELITDILFNFNEDEQKELLFQIKLKVFEMEEVKNTKKTAAKAKIRKAKNVLEVVKEVSKLI